MNKISANNLRAMKIVNLIGHNKHPDLAERNEVLAILSARLALDLVFNAESSASIEEALIHSHLRFIHHIHPTNGLIKSCWIQEPIVSEAAAEFFMLGGARNPCMEVWYEALATVYAQCFTAGLIDRGRTEELVGQVLLLIMERDMVFVGYDHVRDSMPGRTEGENVF